MSMIVCGYLPPLNPFFGAFIGVVTNPPLLPPPMNPLLLPFPLFISLAIRLLLFLFQTLCRSVVVQLTLGHFQKAAILFVEFFGSVLSDGEHLTLVFALSWHQYPLLFFIPKDFDNFADLDFCLKEDTMPFFSKRLRDVSAKLDLFGMLSPKYTWNVNRFFTEYTNSAPSEPQFRANKSRSD